MRLRRACILLLAPWVLLALSQPLARSQDSESHATLIIPEPKDFGRSVLMRTGTRRTAVVQVVDRVKAAVVNIHSQRTAHGSIPADFFALNPSQNRINGMGTGIIIDPRGYIITNHHVIEEVNVIKIRLSDGTTLDGQVVARNADMDLALLKIDSDRPLPTMPLGTAEDLMVGETVVAIGNAYGYEHTVSVGVVSAVKRDVSLNKEMSYKSLIQTDASINPGNSGGPLLNVNGDLVGVNVAIRAGAQCIGFAIPVDAMIRVAADMLRTRRRGTGYDGLLCRDRLEAAEDALVRRVIVEHNDSNSPASAAGLRQGDVLVQVGDVRVACSFDVERGLLDHKAGEIVPVLVRRDGQEKRLELALTTLDRGRTGPADMIWVKLGMQLRPIAPELVELVSRVNNALHGGLEVTALDADGAAAKAGILRGDILVGLHQWEILSVDNVAYVLGRSDLPALNPLSFFVVRNGKVRRGRLGNIN